MRFHRFLKTFQRFSETFRGVAGAIQRCSRWISGADVLVDFGGVSGSSGSFRGFQ